MIAWLLVLSVLLHGVMFSVLGRYLNGLRLDAWEAPVAVHMIDGDALDALTPEQAAQLAQLEARVEEPLVEEEPPEEPERELPDGQVVEVPKPDEEKIPLQADYLAEHDNAVPLETRTERYKVNPDVLSNQYADEAKLALEEVADVGATEMSTGATVGSLSPPQEGSKGAPRSLIPSPWQLTNKEGLAAPVPSSSRNQSLAGAPQNDLLNEKRGAAVALNTREFVGAAYLNRIRRQVNLYWKQNVDNVPARDLRGASNLETVVAVVLDSDGALQSIVVTSACGSEPLDNAVVEAFKIAGPFPNPPEQLIKKDGRVYLDDMSFTVTLGQAHMVYQGIDPRAGVQFPGIMKSPR